VVVFDELGFCDQTVLFSQLIRRVLSCLIYSLPGLTILTSCELDRHRSGLMPFLSSFSVFRLGHQRLTFLLSLFSLLRLV
jgi:hypothetical protein